MAKRPKNEPRRTDRTEKLTGHVCSSDCGCVAVDIDQARQGSAPADRTAEV